MINPADSRKIYFYTPAEVATAREILGTADRYKSHTVTVENGRAYLGAPLYPADWYTWAQKVLTWYGRFTQLLRRYARELGSVALAQVAIWQNLRAGLSVPRMLRIDSAEKQEERTAPARWVNNPQVSREERARAGSYITPINPKTQKHERRAQVIRTTAALQTRAAL